MGSAIKDKWYEERVKIAVSAHEGAWVIFSPRTGKYYSPRGYVESGEEVFFRDPYGSSEKTPEVVLHNASMALSAQTERVTKEQEKLNTLVKIVSESFKFIPKTKK